MDKIYKSDKTQHKKYISLKMNRNFIMLSIMLFAALIFTAFFAMAMFEEQYRLMTFIIIAGFYAFAFIFELIIYFVALKFQKENFNELELIFTDKKIKLEGKYSRTIIYFSDIKKIVCKGEYYLIHLNLGRTFMLPVCCFEERQQIETQLLSLKENLGTFEKTPEQKHIRKILTITLIAGIVLGVLSCFMELFFED